MNFAHVPSDIRVPLFYAEFDNSAANRASTAARALAVGQKIRRGTAGTPDVCVYDATPSEGSNSLGVKVNGHQVTQSIGMDPEGDLNAFAAAIAARPEVATAVASGPGGHAVVTVTAKNNGPGTLNMTDATIGGAGTVTLTTTLGDPEVLADGEAPQCFPVKITSAAQARLAFGAGSHLARLCAAFLAQDPTGDLWAVAVYDGDGSVAAVAGIKVTGTATAAGVLPLYIGGQLVKVAIPDLTEAAAVPALIVAAIAAKDELPVTAADGSGEGTYMAALTARNAGAAGNQISLRAAVGGPLAGEAMPPGLTFAIGWPDVDTTTPLATGATLLGGTTDPDLDAALASIGDMPLDVIVHPYAGSTQLDQIKAELSDGGSGRWSPLRQLYGHGISYLSAKLSDLLSAGAARNNQHETVFGGEITLSPPWEMAGGLAGQVFLSERNDPAMPTHTLPVAGVKGPRAFTVEERQALLADGIATVTVDHADKTTRIDRAITTYQTNGSGAPDDSYLDSETLFTLMRVVRTLKGTVLAKYGRAKLVKDGTRLGPGQVVATPAKVRGTLVAAYKEMEAHGWVQDTDAFAAALIVEINATNPKRLDVLLPPDLAKQLRIFAMLVQFT